VSLHTSNKAWREEKETPLLPSHLNLALLAIKCLFLENYVNYRLCIYGESLLYINSELLKARKACLKTEVGESEFIYQTL
jgi:hypothetical protein